MISAILFLALQVMQQAIVNIPAATAGGGSVAFDAKMTGGNGAGSTYAEITVAGTTITTTGMTVGASATALVATISIGNGNNVSAVTCNWDTTGSSQSMTLQANVGSGTPLFTGIFVLASPHTGNKTLSCSWTGSNQAYLSSASFKNCSGVNATDNTTTASGTSLAVTSSSTGASLASYVDSGGGPGPNFNTIYNAGDLNPDGASNYQIGGTSNSHTAGETCKIAGVHLIP